MNLKNKLTVQVKSTREFKANSSYYKDIVSEIRLTRLQHAAFDDAKRTKLYPWQNNVVEHIMQQDRRKVNHPIFNNFDMNVNI